MDNNINSNEKQQMEQQSNYSQQFQHQSFEQNLQQQPYHQSFEQNLQQQPYHQSFEQNLQQQPYHQSFEQNLQQQPYQQSFSQGLQQQVYQQPYQQSFNQTYESELESPVGFGEWLSAFLIMCIPFVGVVMVFVWAFGGNVKKSKANFFKASLVWGAIWSVVAVTFMVVILMSVAASV